MREPQHPANTYWGNRERFAWADFTPIQKGSQSKAAKHFKDVALCLHVEANNDKGTCWPSLPHLAAWTSLDETTVKKNLDILVETGMILRVVKGGRKSNRYRVNYDHKVWQNDEVEVAKLKAKYFTPQGFQERTSETTNCPGCGCQKDKRSKLCQSCRHFKQQGIPTPSELDNGGVSTVVGAVLAPGGGGVSTVVGAVLAPQERQLTSVTSLNRHASGFPLNNEEGFHGDGQGPSMGTTDSDAAEPCSAGRPVINEPAPPIGCENTSDEPDLDLLFKDLLQDVKPRELTEHELAVRDEFNRIRQQIGVPTHG